MTKAAITLIGAGNMGESLIAGMVQQGYPASKICASDLDETKLKQLEKKYAIRVTTDNIEAVKNASVIIFAIKPQQFAIVAKTLAATIQSQKPLIISIAAGIRITSISEWLGFDASVIRTMPNMPALIGCGATGLYANHFVTPNEKQLAEQIFTAVGSTVWLAKEDLLDVVAALSGSGPAYFFLMMESLANAATELGLSADVARKLSIQTALGAARVATESEKSLETLRQNVTSPGGTTEAAINAFMQHNIHDVIKAVIMSAKTRSEELAQLTGETTSCQKP